ISLIILSILLAGWAVWICRQPSSSYTNPTQPEVSVQHDSVIATKPPTDIITAPSATTKNVDNFSETQVADDYRSVAPAPVRSTRMQDADVRFMTGSHPFSTEAQKVLSGNLEENDSLSRHRILSYCEHLRTSYTTRDLDFIRQVFSDNALIIVGHTIHTAESSSPKGTPKVRYSQRSKREYLANLAKIFDSGKDIDLHFSGFRIMRHPTMEGIYGVTLRQKYSCGTYSDDGWLFLLWDFRDRSMPLIHVRTWQPIKSVGENEDEIIDLSDFNLE
ncbi:MAG: hypothetical protein K2G77_05620, partial [Muribaculaceae bacterium]|nr:hypothetical protein [Muribaculaceae bacterium]